MNWGSRVWIGGCCILLGVISATAVPGDWPGPALTIGRDTAGEPLQVLLSPDAFDYRSNKLRCLLVVDPGPAGSDPRQTAIEQFFARFTPAQQAGCQWAVIIVPPEPGGGPARVYPPAGDAYLDPQTRVAHTIWRFAHLFAPDFIGEYISIADPWWQAQLQAPAEVSGQGRLTHEFSRQSWQGLPGAPGFRLLAEPAAADPAAREFSGLDRFDKLLPAPPEDRLSPLHREVLQRLNRSSQQVVDQLLEVYGRELNELMYQPALAVLIRLERARATGDAAELARVEQLLEPYLSGSKPALPTHAGGSHFSGHLVLSGWAQQQRDERAIGLIRAVAERGFTTTGQPLPAMPTHAEMSDAVFMGCPILIAAAGLCEEPKYLEFAQQHFQFMANLCLRPDGLYRHSPLCEAAWGRGNGFPALGLALSLTELERILAAQPAGPLQAAAGRVRAALLPAFEQHVSALLQQQDPTGMWLQVIDDPRSYRELTATCMIGLALERGLQRGWLQGAAYRTAVDRAWGAVQLRVSERGELVDVCTGTGKQKTLEDYFNRTAVVGPDERGGAMVLLFAWERATAPR